MAALVTKNEKLLADPRCLGIKDKMMDGWRARSDDIQCTALVLAGLYVAGQV